MFPKELDKRLDSPERSSCGSPDDSYVSVKAFCRSEAQQNAFNTKTLHYVDFLKLFMPLVSSGYTNPAMSELCSFSLILTISLLASFVCSQRSCVKTEPLKSFPDLNALVSDEDRFKHCETYYGDF